MNSNQMLITSLDEVVLPEELPPLVIIAFTRPDLLEKVLETVRQQTLLPSKIIAFIDGPRKEEDYHLIKQCIDLLEDFTKVIPIHIIRRTKNLGCDQNIILGLTEVLSSHNSLVYIEDDTLLSPCFYDRMCRLLEVYRDHKQVASISSYASLPSELDVAEDADFFVSNRVFSWGFAIWADRWQEANLSNLSKQYNPFGEYYAIPANCQTKLTMINQFWLEKNKKTDWVISFTLATLYHNRVHIVPTSSFTTNIGFGHPESKTYRGKEQAWVNARYDKNFYPNRLPKSLELPPSLAQPLHTTEIIRHLMKYKGLWLSPSAFLYLLDQSKDFTSMLLASKLFISRIPILLRRWRTGLTI